MRAYRLFTLLLALLLCTAPGLAEATGAERGFFAMDTYMTITAYGEEAQSALEAAEECIHALEGLWSVTDAESEIYALNHAGGAAVPISADTEAILRFALEMAERTQGRFDPTIYPLLTAWGFTTGSYQVPAPEEIAALLPLVGYGQISLSGGEASLPEGVEVDLGAIGKGYAGDEAVAVLRQYGVSCALLNLGGGVQVIGARPDGNPWRVGVLMPFTQENFCVLEAEDCAVITSGDYQRYFTAEDGTLYGHILDPDTGYPAQSGLTSVTIVGAEGKACDALSTALFVMGLDGAIEHWRAHDDFEMLLLTDENGVYITEGLEDTFSLADGYADMEVTVIRR